MNKTENISLNYNLIIQNNSPWIWEKGEEKRPRLNQLQEKKQEFLSWEERSYLSLRQLAEKIRKKKNREEIWREALQIVWSSVPLSVSVLYQNGEPLLIYSLEKLNKLPVQNTAVVSRPEIQMGDFKIEVQARKGEDSVELREILQIYLDLILEEIMLSAAQKIHPEKEIDSRLKDTEKVEISQIRENFSRTLYFLAHSGGSKAVIEQGGRDEKIFSLNLEKLSQTSKLRDAVVRIHRSILVNSSKVLSVRKTKEKYWLTSKDLTSLSPKIPRELFKSLSQLPSYEYLKQARFTQLLRKILGENFSKFSSLTLEQARKNKGYAIQLETENLGFLYLPVGKSYQKMIQQVYSLSFD